MPPDIVNQFINPRPLMIARAFIMHIAKRSLNRVGFGAITWQPDDLESWMIPEPLLDHLRFMYSIVVRDEVNLAGRRKFALKRGEKVDHKEAVLARSCDVRDLTCQVIQGSGQIVLLILPWCHDLGLRCFKHPLIADLRQQVDVQFIIECSPTSKEGDSFE